MRSAFSADHNVGAAAASCRDARPCIRSAMLPKVSRAAGAIPGRAGGLLPAVGLDHARPARGASWPSSRAASVPSREPGEGVTDQLVVDPVEHATRTRRRSARPGSRSQARACRRSRGAGLGALPTKALTVRSVSVWRFIVSSPSVRGNTGVTEVVCDPAVTPCAPKIYEKGCAARVSAAYRQGNVAPMLGGVDSVYTTENHGVAGSIPALGTISSLRTIETGALLR